MRHTRQGALASGSAWTAPRKHRLIFFTRESRMACQRGTIEDAGTRGETSPASKESLPPGYSGSFFVSLYIKSMLKAGRGKIACGNPVLSPLGELLSKEIEKEKLDHRR